MSLFVFLLILLCLNVFDLSSKAVNADAAGSIYSNSWAVQLQPSTTEVDVRLLAETLGMKHRQIFDDFYLLTDQGNSEPVDKPRNDITETLTLNKKIKWAEQQVYEKYSTRSVSFNDPYWNRQWYLRGASRGRITHNIEAAWEKGYTGKGVTVVVIDNGLRHTHKEFKDRYDQSVSYDFVDNDDDPKSLTAHGTKCAGVIAAGRNNNLCGVGVAYDCEIGGIRLFKIDLATDADEASAFFPGEEISNKVDIFSNSWGPSDTGYTVRAPKKLAFAALEKGTEKGRNNLGSIYVFSSGNGGLFDDSCAFDGYANNIYTIAVASVGAKGEIPPHSEPCGAIITSVYSKELVTTSNRSDTACDDNFSKTSAAAAVTSGIIALALQANPNLTWRDVQHLIARSSKQDKVRDTNLVTNGAGFTVSQYFGFGVLDALTLVNNAITWNVSAPPLKKCEILQQQRKRIPADFSFEINKSSCTSGVIKSLEHVQLRLHLTYSRRGQIAVDVTSPSQTKSRFLHPRKFDIITGRKHYTDLVTTNLHFWGEPSLGTWRIRVINGFPNFPGSGNLSNITLILYGTTESFNGGNETGVDNHDIDECSQSIDPCDPNANCVNTVGSFTCQCRRGYTKYRETCYDIDECSQSIDPCDPNANCVNTVGSFTCQCRSGYTKYGETCYADCRSPKHPRNGYYSGSDYSYGATIYYHCDLDYYRQGAWLAWCLSNGQWSSSPPYCYYDWWRASG